MDALSCWHSTDEEDTKREICGLVVDFGMIAFDDPIVFEGFDPVPNGTR